MSEVNPIVRVATDSRGNGIYVEDNEAGGHTYWCDSIGGGVVIWDTCLVSQEQLKIAMELEEKLDGKDTG